MSVGRWLALMMMLLQASVARRGSRPLFTIALTDDLDSYRPTTRCIAASVETYSRIL